MSYTLEVSERCGADIAETAAYIADTLGNPTAAAGLVQSVFNAITSLESLPLRYPALEVNDITVRRFPIDNYLLFYTVNESAKAVNVLRFLYGACDWERML